MRMRRGPDRCECGFTLMELMISATLMALILTAAYQCFSAAIAAQRLMDPRLESAQSARVILDRMAADLRSACPLPGGSAFLGLDRRVGEVEADSLDFATHHYTPAVAGEGDYCAVSYFVERDERTGLLNLCRQRNPGIPLDTVRRGPKDVLLAGVRQLQIEHYDGFEWYESWGDAEGGVRSESSRRERDNLSGMPEAVRITLALEVNPRPRREDGADPVVETEPELPMVFQTVARLVLAPTRSEWSGATGGAGGGSAGGALPGSGGSN